MPPEARPRGPPYPPRSAFDVTERLEVGGHVILDLDRIGRHRVLPSACALLKERLGGQSHLFRRGVRQILALGRVEVDAVELDRLEAAGVVGIRSDELVLVRAFPSWLSSA